MRFFVRKRTDAARAANSPKRETEILPFPLIPIDFRVLRSCIFRDFQESLGRMG
jgi:hypothetical protein